MTPFFQCVDARTLPRWSQTSLALQLSQGEGCCTRRWEFWTFPRFSTRTYTHTHTLSLSFFLSRSLFFQGGFQFLEPAPKITIRAYTMDIFLGRRLPLEQLTFPASATSSQGSQSFASIEAATSSLATADGGASIPSMPQESDPAWLSRVCWFWERTLLPFLIHFVPFSSGFLVF